MKNSIFVACAVVSIGILSGCAGPGGLSSVAAGGTDANTLVSGSAGQSGSQGTPQLHHCAKPISTAALAEDTNTNMLLVQHGLPSSPLPLLRLMMQQSNCFQVVDRGAGLRAMQAEQAMSGTKRNLVAASYTITPNVVFSENNAGGVGAGLASVGGAIFGPVGLIAGAVVGSMRFKEAQVVLFVTDNRTGVQVASATGSGSATDIGLAGAGFGSTSLGASGWSNTNEGKVVSAAMLDALNRLVPQIEAAR